MRGSFAAIVIEVELRRRSHEVEFDVTPNSAPTILSVVGLVVVCPPNLVQPDSLYAELETLAVVPTVARKWAGGTLPKLLWGRSLLYSDRYCSMLSWALLISIK